MMNAMPTICVGPEYIDTPIHAAVHASMKNAVMRMPGASVVIGKDGGRESERQEDVANVRADDVAMREAGAAGGRRLCGGREFGQRGAEPHNDNTNEAGETFALSAAESAPRNKRQSAASTIRIAKPATAEKRIGPCKHVGHAEPPC